MSEWLNSATGERYLTGDLATTNKLAHAFSSEFLHKFMDKNYMPAKTTTLLDQILIYLIYYAIKTCKKNCPEADEYAQAAYITGILASRLPLDRLSIKFDNVPVVPTATVVRKKKK